MDEPVNYQISINLLDDYKETGFKEGDYTLLYAVNQIEAEPFLVRLQEVSGILAPIFVDKNSDFNKEEAERYYYLSQPKIDKRTALSFGVGFTPADTAVDIVDFIAGKDIITGEEINRWLLLACIITPQVIDAGITVYGKHADDIAKFVLNGSYVPMSVKLLGNGDKLASVVKWIKPLDGYTDIIIHGSEDAFWRLRNSEWIAIDQRTLVTFIKKSEEYQGGAIRLISCNTGKLSNGVAKDLANKLGVEVLAPSDTLWIGPKGMIIGPNYYTNSGQWVQFLSGK